MIIVNVSRLTALRLRDFRVPFLRLVIPSSFFYRTIEANVLVEIVLLRYANKVR